jgi:hypothetical protein
MILNLDVSETVEKSAKNTSGIVIEEKLTLTIKINIVDSKKRILLSDSVSNSRKISITNNLSTDEATKKKERRNLLQGLSQKVKFKLQLIAKRQ